LEFPQVEANNLWGVLSKPTNTEPSPVRRLSGLYPINTSLNSNNPLAWTDIKISLDMNLTGLNNYYTKTEVNNSLALNAPIYNPTFTGTISINGTLTCPQLDPQISQTNFNTIKTPGLYHYDGGLSNAPSSSLNFRSIEIGREDRYTQIALPCDADQMVFQKAAE